MREVAAVSGSAGLAVWSGGLELSLLVWAAALIVLIFGERLAERFTAA